MSDRALPRPLMWILTTALRLLPWPVRAGLRRVGRPDATSPVILTGNFALTVDRVHRALRGSDVWLLVANSRGINVWCASAGGHLTTHDVISALKTSGVAEKVSHRRVVLPQLAATGVEEDAVRERADWKIAWGPVEADMLPAFLRGDRSAATRHVTFGMLHRLEMAVMWAAPLSLASAVAAFLWPAGALPLLGMIWGLALAVYLGFPLYESLISRGSFAGFSVLFGTLAMAGTALMGVLSGDLTVPFLLRWTAIGTAIVLILGIDLAGSTPLYKSWMQPERRYRVDLREELCTACGRCEQVCPRGVFEVAGVASLPGASDCEQCAACIVQCPEDALSFSGPAGERVTPDTVRRHKLNMMGRRQHSDRQ